MVLIIQLILILNNDNDNNNDDNDSSISTICYYIKFAQAVKPQEVIHFEARPSACLSHWVIVFDNNTYLITGSLSHWASYLVTG